MSCTYIDFFTFGQVQVCEQKKWTHFVPHVLLTYVQKGMLNIMKCPVKSECEPPFITLGLLFFLVSEE